MHHDRNTCAVLISGGIDSAVLLSMEMEHGATVYPLYIQSGFQWESVELEHLQHFLTAIAQPQLLPLQLLNCPVDDLYPDHWSLTGVNVPNQATNDDAVFLPGRNLLLLSKAMLWCHLHQVPRVVLATLQGNPFPDATESFFTKCAETVSQAVHGDVQATAPFRLSSKSDVIELGRDLPLQWTFSCIDPIEGRHCGICNKCAERRGAFHFSGVTDPTEYHEQQGS